METTVFNSTNDIPEDFTGIAVTTERIRYLVNGKVSRPNGLPASIYPNIAKYFWYEGKFTGGWTS